MNIEHSPIEFHPTCQFEKLKLSQLQIQYLTFLRMNKSIYDLIQNNLKNGLPISFTELYALVESLSLHSWILNPEIKDYFQNIKGLAKNTLQSEFSLQDHLKKPASQIDPNPQKNDADLKVFLQLPFFRSLDPELSEFLFKSSKKYHLKENTLICKANDLSRTLFVLLSGQAGIYKQIGPVKQLIALLNRSTVFGEAGFLLNKPRSADILTLKESILLTIPYTADVLDPHLNKTKATQLQYRFWVQHALLNSELFKNFPADCLDALTLSGKFVEIKKDMTLFRQGDKSESAYIIIQGKLDIRKNEKSINTLTQGAFVGEIALMASNGIRTATVNALQDTLLLEIHRNEFYKLLSQNLYLARELEKLVASRLKADIKK